MSAQDFAVGSTIQLIVSPKKRGVVLGNNLKSGPDLLAVEWEDGSLDKVRASDVKEALTLEQEFELAKTSINSKLAQAAALILEAAKDAETAGSSLLEYEDDYSSYPTSEFEIDKIRRAMDQAGWNTSSWYC